MENLQIETKLSVSNKFKKMKVIQSNNVNIQFLYFIYVLHTIYIAF